MDLAGDAKRLPHEADASTSRSDGGAASKLWCGLGHEVNADKSMGSGSLPARGLCMPRMIVRPSKEAEHMNKCRPSNSQGRCSQSSSENDNAHTMQNLTPAGSSATLLSRVYDRSIHR